MLTLSTGLASVTDSWKHLSWSLSGRVSISKRHLSCPVHSLTRWVPPEFSVCFLIWSQISSICRCLMLPIHLREYSFSLLTELTCTALSVGVTGCFSALQLRAKQACVRTHNSLALVVFWWILHLLSFVQCSNWNSAACNPTRAYYRSGKPTPLLYSNTSGHI